MYMHHIEMYRTADCVHEILVYQYCSKIVCRDITNRNYVNVGVNSE